MKQTKPQEKQKKVRLTLWISPEAKKQAQMLAVTADMTVGKLFESLVNRKETL